MRTFACFTVAALTAFTISVAPAQNSTSGLATVPGMSGESSGTVTGSGAGREGQFGSPGDRSDVGAARGSTRGDMKGSTPRGRGKAGDNGGGTGSDRRGSASGGSDPR